MSRVVEVRTHVLEIPRPEPVRSSYATYSALGVVVVEAVGSSGEVGQGWTNVIGGGAAAIGLFARDELVPLVIGTDTDEVRGTWERMYLQSVSRGRAGVAMYALSAIDLALWDLRCRELGRPLHAVLGRCSDRVPVYGDGCWLSYGHDQLAAAAIEYHDRAFWGVKVKIGDDLADAATRVSLVRDIVGTGGRVMVDANQRYDPVTAKRAARLLEEYDLTWLEEPMPVGLVAEYAELAKHSPIPVAAGENAYSRYEFRDLIERRAIQIAQPDVHRVGGVTEFMRVAALAEARGMPVAPHTSWEVHSQLLACVTTGLAVEYFDWFPDDVLETRPEIRDGQVELASEPGLGSRISETSLRRYAV